MVNLLNQINMKHNYQLLCCTVALGLCAGQLFAQDAVLKPGSSGLQAYHPIKKWRGLDIQSYLAGIGLFGGSQNTATGTQALYSNTSGSYNTADGYQALYSNTSGTNNTAVGNITLEGNSTGSNNTAIGAAALIGNGSSGYNTAVGAAAMQHNSSGNYNTGIGAGAMLQNITGGGNTAVGSSAMTSLNSGSANAALGDGAMGNQYWGSYETALGSNALGGGISGPSSSPTEGYSVAVGYSTLYNSAAPNGCNTATGSYAMYDNTTGYYNAVNGAYAMYYNTTGYYNAANGYLAMYENTSGYYNLADGAYAMYDNTTGNDNTGVGAFATVTSGSLSNATALGFGALASSSNSVIVGNSSVTSIGGAVGWTNFSDGRYKKNIQQNVPGLAFINKLTPITYTLDVAGIETKSHENDKQVTDKNLPSRPNYLNDPVLKQAMQEKSAITYTGFVAQDVEKAADSVGFTFSGIDKPKDVNESFYGLRYGDFVVPLVKAVQELSVSSNSKDSAINVLQGQMDSVESKYNALQVQVNELRALLIAQKSTAGASLDQNIPNPFTGSTTIGYNLPKGTSSAKLQITDVNGHVLGIIPLSVSAGKSTLTASLSGYAAGTYMYSLILNGQLVGTRQMIEVR
jgi:trimeric autotransporter adhesin